MWDDGFGDITVWSKGRGRGVRGGSVDGVMDGWDWGGLSGLVLGFLRSMCICRDKVSCGDNILFFINFSPYHYGDEGFAR